MIDSTQVVKQLLQSVRVIGLAVTLRASGLRGHDLVLGEVRVLRARLREYLAIGEEGVGLGRRSNLVLRELALSVVAAVDVALGPRVDGEAAALEDDGAAGDLDGGRDVVEHGVVEDERAGEGARAGGRGLHEDGRVGDGGVNDGETASGLRVLGGTPGHEVEADTAVVDSDALVGPSPVPDGVDGRLCVVDGDVLNREPGGRVSSCAETKTL